MDLEIRSRRVLTPHGIRPGCVQVRQGKIVAVAGHDWISDSATPVDAGDMIVMPGVVDTHVHVNEPGRTEWEGFTTATRAAAAGGVTTILDMPLNSIPATTTVEALDAKREAAAGQCAVNVEFIGGVVPGNTKQLKPLADSGVRAFKCFLAPSGVEEFDHVTENDLRDAFPVLASLGLPLMVHSEDPAKLHPMVGSTREYSPYMKCRPVEAEHSAIRLLVRLLEWCPTPVHVVHLSSASSLDIIDEARARGLPITVETCPHYLTFKAEGIRDGATDYKCAPPIRGETEREGLWHGLVAGRIDLIASDHSPCLPGMKETGGDFYSAWGGIASLQLSLAAVWTGARQRGIPIERIAGWMSAAPARLAGLEDRKGAIVPGFDADIAIWDPEASFVVDRSALQQRHKVTPYLDHELYGKVIATYVAGQRVYADNARLS
ncbi:MAG TPA: allantoinase AllB [Gemmatimonadaceae bacterium]|nr:allantoinase AllB [Gemmatimonadaceae bacterium]